MDLSSPKISVIVPVYNTGRILIKTTRSLLMQSLTDFEVLLVNDGSTCTNTLSVLKFLETSDSRIRIVNKENEGIELTRLRGIKEAKGKYLIHCDHDDTYLPDAFKTLILYAEKDNVDIVIGTHYLCYGSWMKKEIGFSAPNLEIINRQTFLEKYYRNYFGVNLFNVSLWAKMYKRSLYTEKTPIILNENLIEDLVHNIQVLPWAEKICFVNTPLYKHYYGGLSYKYIPFQSFRVYANLYQLKLEKIKEYKLPEYRKFIDIELYNVLYQTVYDAFVYEINRKEILGFLEKLQNSDSFKILTSDPNFKKDSLFFSALRENNYESAYNLIETEIKKDRKKILLRKALKKIARKFL